MQRVLTRLLAASAVIMLFAACDTARAQGFTEAQKQEFQAAAEAADKQAIKGPANIALRDQADLVLPDGMVFVPAEAAKRVERAWGNIVGDDYVGMILSGSGGRWHVQIRWTGDGYVRDDEAKDFNPADLLKSISDATEQGNKERVSRGYPEITVTGWTQEPRYDAHLHQLAWSLSVAQKANLGAVSVNFNTRALGRHGFFSFNLIDSPAFIEQDRPVSRQPL